LQCMFFTSLLHVNIAHLLLLSCMLVTSLLHVILVVCTHYFSRIYQSILFLCCFLHGCPLFALPLNPSLKHIYTLPLSTPFLCSLLLIACYYIYSVHGLDRQT
jgi:hypothetical protein